MIREGETPEWGTDDETKRVLGAEGAQDLAERMWDFACTTDIAIRKEGVIVSSRSSPDFATIDVEIKMHIAHAGHVFSYALLTHAKE